MQILDNLIMLKKQIINIIFSPLNRLMILSCSSQIASMFCKTIIKSIKSKSFSLKHMTTYGGMPSSHTVFIMSLLFGIALDKNYGWQSPLFAFAIVMSGIILTDTIKFRGTVDKLNEVLKTIVENSENLKKKIKLPKPVAHTGIEIIAGIIFAFFYTSIFYIFLYSIFPVQ